MIGKEESLNRVFRAFPENSLKNKIRAVYYDIIQDSVKVHYRDGFLIRLDGHCMRFRDTRAVLPELEICVKGYLARSGIRRGDVVVDAGAFTGTFTTIASRMTGDEGKVIAFEPDTENCKSLQATIDLNRLRNVIVVQKGLWNSDSKIPFFNAHNAGSSFVFDKFKTDSIVETPVVSLDRELERLGIDRIDFMKMDVEGAEIEAIKGAKDTLTRSNPKLAIASYHILDGQETSHELEKLLEGIGYSAETSFPQHKTTYALKR